MTLKNMIKLAIIIAALLPLPQIRGQITIGSGYAPNEGSLLDLKENNSIGENANKGLILPLVELKDTSKLIMGDNEILDTDDGGGQYSKHTGLLVCNVGTKLCEGIYIWSGTEWTSLLPCDKAKLSISTSATSPPIFASGSDLGTITPSQLDLSWVGENGTISWSSPNITLTVSPEITSESTSPTTLTITPEAVSFDEIVANPFHLKTSTLVFQIEKDGEIATSDPITINQINKSFSLATTNEKVDSSEAVTKTNTIKGNVNWRVKSISSSPTITDIKLNGTTSLVVGSSTTDWELNDGTGAGDVNNLSYTIQGGASKSRFSTIVFEDTSTPKRANDIQLTVFQCQGTGNYPTMSDWALVAGFSNVLSTTDWKKLSSDIERANADNAAAINTPNSKTGIA